MRTPKSPADTPIVSTPDAIPRICPSCASKDLGKVDNVTFVRVTCQACGGTARYQVKA
jgi:RNase P subunit RPR2